MGAASRGIYVLLRPGDDPRDSGIVEGGGARRKQRWSRSDHHTHTQCAADCAAYTIADACECPTDVAVEINIDLRCTGGDCKCRDVGSDATRGGAYRDISLTMRSHRRRAADIQIAYGRLR